MTASNSAPGGGGGHGGGSHSSSSSGGTAASSSSSRVSGGSVGAALDGATKRLSLLLQGRYGTLILLAALVIHSSTLVGVLWYAQGKLPPSLEACTEVCRPQVKNATKLACKARSEARARMTEEAQATARVSAANAAAAAAITANAAALVKGELLQVSQARVWEAHDKLDQSKEDIDQMIDVIETRLNRKLVEIERRNFTFKAKRSERLSMGVLAKQVDRLNLAVGKALSDWNQLFTFIDQYVQDHVSSELVVAPKLEVCSASKLTSLELPDGEDLSVCQVNSVDNYEEQWILFGDINAPTGNFDTTSLAASPTHSGKSFGNSMQVGTFSAGVLGAPGYSLDVARLANLSGDETKTFDLLIQFGDVEVYSKYFAGFPKTDMGFINNRRTVLQNIAGEHGMWGSTDYSPAGYFAVFCALHGQCGSRGNYFWSFSKDGRFPKSAKDIICGFYGLGGAWKQCPEGDNIHRMRYYIRLHPYAEDEYSPVGLGDCLSEKQHKYNAFKLNSASCETEATCRHGCSLFKDTQCHGFQHHRTTNGNGCGYCELNMQAHFDSDLGGWTLSRGGGGVGPVMGSTDVSPPGNAVTVQCVRRGGPLTSRSVDSASNLTDAGKKAVSEATKPEEEVAPPPDFDTPIEKPDFDRPLGKQ